MEIHDVDNAPAPGFTFDGCPLVFGDAIEGTITWNEPANRRDGVLCCKMPIFTRYSCKL